MGRGHYPWGQVYPVALRVAVDPAHRIPYAWQHMSSGSVLTSKAPLTPPTSRQAYVDVDRLKNSHGMVSVISQRTRSGELTYSIFREFEREGGMDRTSFLPEHLIDEHIELIKMTRERMAELRASGELPYRGAGERARR